MIACWANWRSSGSRELRISSTVGLPTPWVISVLIWLMMSAGMMSAAWAWPLFTLAIAASRDPTRIGVIDWNSWLA